MSPHKKGPNLYKKVIKKQNVTTGSRQTDQAKDYYRGTAWLPFQTVLTSNLKRQVKFWEKEKWNIAF